MAHDHSVTNDLNVLKQSADPIAAQRIWERYVSQLIRLAKAKLKNTSRRVSNEEDVVQVAFENFFRSVKENRFPKLDDREDLWQILAMLVDRRAKDQIRHLNTLRNGAGRVHGDSINKDIDQNAILDRVEDFQPTADAGVELAEQFELRLQQLHDNKARQCALLKLEGCTNNEISERTGMSLRSIERRLNNIREIWQQELE